MTVNIVGLAKDFIMVADMAGVPLSADDLSVESLCAPHNPPPDCLSGKWLYMSFAMKVER